MDVAGHGHGRPPVGAVHHARAAQLVAGRPGRAAPRNRLTLPGNWLTAYQERRNLMANWRGTWASGTAYIADDSVTYGGVTYYCVTANTGQTPGTGADWALQDVFKGP